MTARIRIAGGSADLSQQVLELGDERTRLTTKERDLLAYLTAHPDRTVTRRELLVSVWGHPENASDEPVYSAVKRLRAKIDRGDHQHIVSVHGDGYRWAPPELGASPSSERNLVEAPGPSAPPTRFFGRKDELLAIARAFEAGARLVTLVGPGGAGKTRCTLEVARGAPWIFCDLSSATPSAATGHPASVIGLVAAALDVPLEGRSPAEGVASVGRALAASPERGLILDNCEAVIDDAAALAAAWLPYAPRLLATSREPLRVRGEHVVPVGPLSPAEALSLFADRVASAGGHPGDAALQASVVDRVDRLPLAIELAAAQIPVLGGEALSQSLDALLATLVVGARDAPARHATLRAAVEWSWTLLSPREQEVLCALSVFAGPFSIEAARAVVGAADAVVVLASLSRRCQLFRDGERFTLYAAVRELARERAAPQTEAKARHVTHTLTASEAAAALLEGPRHREGAALLRADRAELRVAFAAAEAPLERARLALTLDRALGLQGEDTSSRRELLAETRAAIVGEPGAEALIASLLLAEGRIEGAPTALLEEASLRAAGPFAKAEVLLALGERRASTSLLDAEETLEEARSLLPGSAGALAGRVLSRLGEVYWARGLVREASARLREALAIHIEVGDRRSIARTSALLAHVDRIETGGGAGTALLERAETAANELGEPLVRARVLTDLGQHWTRLGDQAGARAALDEAAALYASVGLARERAFLDLHVAETLIGLGDLDEALRVALRARAAVAAEGEVGLSTVHEAVGCIHLLRDDLEAAEASIEEGLRVAEATCAERSTCTLLGKRGLLRLARGDSEGAWADFDAATQRNEARGAITIAASSLADRAMASFARGNETEGARDLATARARLGDPKDSSLEGKMLRVCEIAGKGFAALERGEPPAEVHARARSAGEPIFDVSPHAWDVVLRLSDWLMGRLGAPRES